MTTLLERAQNEGTPLIGGAEVTFLWKGTEPAYLLGDFNNFDLDRAPQLKAVEMGLWSHVMAVPPDAYLEYVWAVDRRYEGTSEEHSAPDPFNDDRKPNGIGGTNHYVYMPEAAPTRLVRRRKDTKRGDLSRHQISTGGMAGGTTRTVGFYRPAHPGPVPLLVLFDGNDYLRQAKVTAIVDNLISEGRMQPIAMAMPWNGPARFSEYACSEATVDFVLRSVLPAAREHLDLADGHGVHGVLGASMGGVMALFLGLRSPDLFGKVYSQAGAFSLGEDGERDTVVYDLVRAGGAAPLDVRIDNGTYDFLFETNKRMYEELARLGCRVTYNEFNAGHNFYAWRDALGAGLEALFPPQP